jgi:16S rRNA C967 or C1407 C5-methylase (RsmB/RsmF family)
MAPEFGNVRRALDALTPEQRQRFIENLKRWANLPPEEKKALADREGMHRRWMAENIDRAISETGLKLEGERRALFAKRYCEERRKVEQQLRKELEEKRQPLIKDILARLKTEFSVSSEGNGSLEGGSGTQPK